MLRSERRRGGSAIASLKGGEPARYRDLRDEGEEFRVIGELYEHALAGWARPEIEHADGSRIPLQVDGWLHESPGDKSILDRCEGPTLDIGSGPGRLTVALAERGIPALGIDITPYAVGLARSSGALVLLRDVFDRVPGTGR